MKRLLVLSFVLLAALSLMIVGCSSDNDSNLLTNNNTLGSTNTNTVEEYTGPPRLSVTFFDKPAPEGIEHLYLHVTKVGIHHEDSGWMYNDIDTTIDFLELVNGITVTLFDDTIPEGYYSQMRLVLGEGNEIVVDSMTYPLTVPSGMQTGVKLNFDFSIYQDEFIRLYVDFDVSKSVIVANDNYKLKPTYRVFKEDISATLGGMVTDSDGFGISNALVEANSSEYSTATYTDSTGYYMFILPMGTYDIEAIPDSGYIVDTSYTGVMLNAGDALMGFDFVISEEITEGTVSGMVTNEIGAPVIGTMVSIESPGYSDSAMTDTLGGYMFTVPAGTYEIEAEADSGYVVDTSYSGVIVNAGDALMGFDFVISEEISEGTISGMVTDTLGSPLANFVVSAESSGYSTTTMTDSLGAYMFILPVGTYDIMAVVDSTMTVDTTYSGVILNDSDYLTGYDFIVY